MAAVAGLVPWAESGTSIGIAIALALCENLTKTSQIAGNVLQRFTIAHTLQKRRIRVCLPHITGSVAPCAEDRLYFFRPFRGSRHRAGDQRTGFCLILRKASVNELIDRICLPPFALGVIGGFYHSGTQSRIVLRSPTKLLQQCRELVLCGFLCLLQLFQRLYSAGFSAQLGK